MIDMLELWMTSTERILMPVLTICLTKLNRALYVRRKCPECEQIAIESSRSYQINQMKNQRQKEFLQAQLARMKQINPDAKYPDVR